MVSPRSPIWENYIMHMIIFTIMLFLRYRESMIGSPIAKTVLENLYITQKKPSREIAQHLSCSEHKVDYWLAKHGIHKRSLSDAIYLQRNPNGDPFSFNNPKNSKEWFLFGLGLGLYWGEGTKKNKTAVRLGNTDPALVKKFLEFLYRIYSVREGKVRFGLQIFSDMRPEQALSFWCSYLGVSRKDFGKVIVTPARSIGTYREKTKHGVLTVYVCNKKLRDELCKQIEILRQIS